MTLRDCEKQLSDVGKLASLALGLILGFSACTSPGFVTGGGHLPSSDGVPGDKANLGFSGQQCDLSQPATGNFNYHDTHAAPQPGGVQMNGDVVDAAICSCGGSSTGSRACVFCVVVFGCPSNPSSVYGIDVNYRSTNSQFPGTGTAAACVIDNGEGVNATEDQAAVRVFTGPFAGYFDRGPAQGNIQAHSCS
jgi:hypothetical protein